MIESPSSKRSKNLKTNILNSEGGVSGEDIQRLERLQTKMQDKNAGLSRTIPEKLQGGSGVSLASDSLRSQTQTRCEVNPSTTAVGIGLTIKDLLDIDVRDHSFKINFSLEASWEVPENESPHRNAWESQVQFPPNLIPRGNIRLRWTPRLVFSNCCELAKLSELYEEVRDEGSHRKFGDMNLGPLRRDVIVYRLHALGRFQERFELTSFPLDAQDLQVGVISRRPESHVKLIQSKNYQSVDKFLINEYQWYELSNRMVAIDSRTDASESSIRGRVYPKLTFSMKAMRNSSFYNWHLVVPKFLIIIVALASIFQPVDHLNSRLIFVMTIRVASVAHSNRVLSGDLPKIPYPSPLDEYVNLCNFVLLLIMLESTGTYLTLKVVFDDEDGGPPAHAQVDKARRTLDWIEDRASLLAIVVWTSAHALYARWCWMSFTPSGASNVMTRLEREGKVDYSYEETMSAHLETENNQPTTSRASSRLLAASADALKTARGGGTAPSSSSSAATTADVSVPLMPAGGGQGIADDDVGQSMRGGRRPEQVPPAATVSPRSKPCNCKYSKCLKLYCDCFAMSRFCKGCNCKDCFNNEEHSNERNDAIKATLEKNPQAILRFQAKSEKGSGKHGDAGNQEHSSGCHCKKSRCLKKYCECFEAAVYCGDKCKCLDCENFEGSHQLTHRKNKSRDLWKIQASQIRSSMDDWPDLAEPDEPDDTSKFLSELSQAHRGDFSEGLFPEKHSSPQPDSFSAPLSMPLLHVRPETGNQFASSRLLAASADALKTARGGGGTALSASSAATTAAAAGAAAGISDPLMPAGGAPSALTGAAVQSLKRGRSEQREALPVTAPVVHIMRPLHVNPVTFVVSCGPDTKKLLISVFECLDDSELYRCSLVCKAWTQLAFDPQLWDYGHVAAEERFGIAPNTSTLSIK